MSALRNTTTSVLRTRGDPDRSIPARIEYSKPNRFDRNDEAAQSLYTHRFDGLVVIYFDADGLRRGFQFWLNWPGGAGEGRALIPIYFAPEVAPPGLEEQLCAARGERLVLLCLSDEGGLSSRKSALLAALFQGGLAARGALVVVLANGRSGGTWRRTWPLPGSQGFPLGCYTTSPGRCPERSTGTLSWCRFPLRLVRPRKSGEVGPMKSAARGRPVERQPPDQ